MQCGSCFIVCYNKQNKKITSYIIPVTVSLLQISDYVSGNVSLHNMLLRNKQFTVNRTSYLCTYRTVQLSINFTHACREHVSVCTLMACNFVNYQEYFNFARFGSVRSRATVHNNILEYTLHE